MLKVPGFESSIMEILPAKPGKYSCVEGRAGSQHPSEALELTALRVMLCRHPVYANGAVVIAMSVRFRKGDNPPMDEFDGIVDDLRMF